MILGEHWAKRERTSDWSAVAAAVCSSRHLCYWKGDRGLRYERSSRQGCALNLSHTGLRVRRVHSTVAILGPEHRRECRRARHGNRGGLFSLVVPYQLMHRWWACGTETHRLQRHSATTQLVSTYVTIRSAVSNCLGCRVRLILSFGEDSKSLGLLLQ